MTSAPTRDTVDVILQGAMRALGRHGTARLSMTDICREAGVSRGTLYRYFTSREEVLDAVNLHITETSRDAFDSAVAADPDPANRLRVMLRAMLEFPNTFPHMRAMFEYEPKVSIDFLNREMATVIVTISEYLEPALEGLPAAEEGLLTADDLAEFLYRMVTSSFLIPPADPAAMESKIANLWDFACGRPVKSAKRRTKRAS